MQLNQHINYLQYLGNDANNKPCVVNPGSEIKWTCCLELDATQGPASLDRGQDSVEMEVWQPVLQLRQIVEVICAPAITRDQIAYSEVLIGV